MRLFVLGVNHKSASVALRERIAFGGDEIPAALTELSRLTAGAVIVSTCNRTEIYALAPDDQIMDDVAAQVVTWLAAFKGIQVTQITPHVYCHQDTLALTHWIRVAAGLDSMILGEPQILGQIKTAILQAEEAGSLSPKLGWLVQQVFAAAKQVRSETQVGAQAVSLGFAAARLVTQIFDKPHHTTLLVVAAGEMNRLVATNIAGLGVARVIICNRSPERAALLAEALRDMVAQVDTVSLAALPEVLPLADIVTSCSGSLYTLIDKSLVKQAQKKRRYRPQLMVDLAVPRDIDPRVGELDDVYLYSIDDLQHVIAGNLEQRRQAAVEAELLVSQLVVGIERRILVRRVGQDIHDYREQARHHADRLLQHSLQRLTDGQPADVVLTELTHQLTQTLTHAPSKLLRQVASEQPADTVNFVAQQLTHAYRPKQNKV